MKRRSKRKRHRRNGYWAESGWAQVSALEAVGMLSCLGMALFVLLKPKNPTAGLGLAHHHQVRFR